MENEKKINWFPGHMAKAMRKTEEDVKLCDGVIYVLDARAPYASVNQKLMKIFGNKPVVYALNKVDAISLDAAKKIVSDFRSKGLNIEPINGLLKKDAEKLKAACGRAVKEKAERNKNKGINKTFRFMVAGIPNTGKSTIINTMSGKKKAETGDKAGITRSNKWIRLGDIELLDTPGTMPPSMENQRYAEHLAFIGAINDDILDLEGLTLKLIAELKEIAPAEFKEKYKLDDLTSEPLSIFEAVCKKRGYILKGGDADYGRCARAIIADLRKGRIGKICFEVEA